MRWYVYLLIDPRNNSPFYVGKGTGDRLNRHESLVWRGKERNPIKREIIEEIWRQGLSVGKEINAYFPTSTDAYKHESQLIRELRPIANGARTDIYSFFALVRDYAIKRSPETGRRILRLFPEHSLPTNEHRILRDAVREAIG